MRKIKVGLLVNEFFDGDLGRFSGFGGYGMLARHYLTQLVPDADLEIETILGFGDGPDVVTRVLDGRKKVTQLPGYLPCRVGPGLPVTLLRRWRRRARMREYLRSFDVFVSVETMPHTRLVMEKLTRRNMVIYVRDPRPQSDWDELDTVIHTRDGCPGPDADTQRFYQRMIAQNRLRVISQGQDLVAKARELYRWPGDFPVQVVPSAVNLVEMTEQDWRQKRDAVIYLGRLDPVKRPWLALETARRMPGVKFYFLGVARDPVSSYIIYPYRDLPNVEFLGQESGARKWELLKQCKVMINPSIHEAIPNTFLEGMSCGTLLVSCQNPDGLTERFGVYTGRILGDGRDQADRFVQGIEHILADDVARERRGREAREYVRTHHDPRQWARTMRQIIRAAAE